MMKILLLLLLTSLCLSLNINNYKYQLSLSNNNLLNKSNRWIMKADATSTSSTSISDAEKESKLTNLYSLSKISAMALVAKEIIVCKSNLAQASLAIASYSAAAIASSVLESASKRTRLSGTTFKTLNCALTTSAKFSLVMSSIALWKYPITSSAMKTNYWLIILHSLLTISPCMKALKLGDRSLLKSPKISLYSILGVSYLASSLHFFLQSIKNLFLIKSAFPVPYHSYGLFLVPGSLLTLHDAANNDYTRLRYHHHLHHLPRYHRYHYHHYYCYHQYHITIIVITIIITIIITINITKFKYLQESKRPGPYICWNKSIYYI